MLEDAVTQVDRIMGWPAGRRELERVEVTRSGAILLTARAPGGFRWFSFEARRLRELQPGKDPKVPLCATLDAAARGVIVSWRPGRRICLAGEWNGQRCYVKGYRHRKSGPAARGHARVHAACWGAGTFTVPGVLHEDEETGALALSLVPGEALPVKAGRAAAFFRVGRALRLLQRDVDTQDLPVHGAEEELALLGRLAARLEPVLGELPPAWGDTLGRLVSGDAPSSPGVASHRDLHPGQLLHAPNAVGLVDFDLLCGAHPLLDLANLTAHLRLRALQALDGSTHVDADDCALATLEGYSRDLSSDDGRALRFFQATTFLRLALIYAIRPRWADLAPQLARLAGRCLDG